MEANLIKKYLLSLPDNTRLFRNNVGLATTRNGHTIRYGLCTGSSDLIGWTTREITPEMVGQKVAIFTAVELKTKNVRVTPEQWIFLEQVKKAGGIAILHREPQ
jgi:hypothetical protein